MTAKKCCCFDLRTGNIIIAWLDVLSIFAITSLHNAQSCLVVFFAGILSLYAIYKHRSEFLWPSLIVRGIILSVSSVVLISLLAGSAFLVEDEKDESMQELLITMGIALAFGIAIQSYFFYVVLSFFKQMKAEALEKVQVVQFDNIERGLYPKLSEQNKI